jgi:hypothetical protein
MIAVAAIAIAVGPLVGAAAASAADGETLFKEECSACHMAYPARLLPAVSWLTILQDLHHHFGENASLDPESVLAIADYLSANAADAPNGDPRALRGLAPDQTPLRITETPYWIRRHHDFAPEDFRTAKVKSPSNCLACHSDPSFEDFHHR